jgi:hypothetical protein
VCSRSIKPTSPQKAANELDRGQASAMHRGAGTWEGDINSQQRRWWGRGGGGGWRGARRAAVLRQWDERPWSPKS